MRKIFSIPSVLMLGVWATTAAASASGFSKTAAPMQRLQTLELRDLKADGYPFGGISDLAWDPGSRTLYALSDRGILFHLALAFDDTGLKEVSLQRALPLRDAEGHPLRGKKNRDAEGMARTPGGDLLIVFERRPRALLYRPDGRLKGAIPLPKPLRKKRNYRTKNHMLEAVAWHPHFGMVTGAERALKKEKSGRHTLYTDRRTLHFPSHGALTALEVTPKGRLLILERHFDKKRNRRTLFLSLLDPRHCRSRGSCRTRLLAMFRSDTEEAFMENYEGLTRLEGDLYLMISDNDYAPDRRTLLTLFRISE